METDPASASGETPESAPPGGAPETPPEADPFAPIDGEPDQFPRDYVEKLRREGGGYRTKLRDAEEQVKALAPLAGMFEGWESDQVEGWKTFLGSAQENPEAALAALLQDGFGFDRDSATSALEAIYGDGAATPPPESGSEDDPNRPMTRAEYDAERTREADETAVQKEIAAIHSEAKELGLDPDAAAGTPDEFRFQRLLHLAATKGCDLKTAHEALEAEEQALVKRHLDSLAEKADQFPSLTGNGGPGAPASDAPKTFADADRRAGEWIRNSNPT